MWFVGATAPMTKSTTHRAACLLSGVACSVDEKHPPKDQARRAGQLEAHVSFSKLSPDALYEFSIRFSFPIFLPSSSLTSLPHYLEIDK